MKLLFPCLVLATSIGTYKTQIYGARGGSGTTNQGFRGSSGQGFRGTEFNDAGLGGSGNLQGQAGAPVYANYRFDGFGRVNLGPLIDRISDSVIRELQRLVDEEGYRFENFLERRTNNLRDSYSGVTNNNIDSYFRGGSAGREAAGYSSYFP